MLFLKSFHKRFLIFQKSVFFFYLNGACAGYCDQSRGWNLSTRSGIANQKFFLPHLLVSVEHPREVGDFYLGDAAPFSLRLYTLDAFREGMATRAWKGNSSGMRFFFSLVRVDILRELVAQLEAVVLGQVNVVTELIDYKALFSRCRSGPWGLNSRRSLRTRHEQIVQGKPALQLRRLGLR